MPPDSPRPVSVRRGASLQVSGGQTTGMERFNALTELSEHVCSSLMVAHPRSASDIHHHGSQDTIVYCVSGEGGGIESEGGSKREALKPGDWALIPAGKEHREVNDGDEDTVWVIVRAPGGTPQVVNLTGWGGEEVKN